MVSIRRRKLLGLCSGRSSFLTPLAKVSDYGKSVENRTRHTNPVSIHPMPSSDQPKQETTPEYGPGSLNLSTSNSPIEQQPHQFPEVKRRKRHRRKHSEHHEPCLMRGVYFKNMKWQAAIKVDKKQIHLGTVGSQEEAARLYDRAAFMCGREPNFELSEEEKKELRKFNWEEFLTITRSAITNKKQRRKTGAGSRKKSEPSMQTNESEDEQGGYDISVSEDAEPEASVY